LQVEYKKWGKKKDEKRSPYFLEKRRFTREGFLGRSEDGGIDGVCVYIPVLVNLGKGVMYSPFAQPPHSFRYALPQNDPIRAQAVDFCFTCAFH